MTGRKRFFFEKKNQKTFINLRQSLFPRHSHKGIKVFLLFFVHKKKRFLFVFRNVVDASLRRHDVLLA